MKIRQALAKSWIAKVSTASPCILAQKVYRSIHICGRVADQLLYVGNSLTPGLHWQAPRQPRGSIMSKQSVNRGFYRNWRIRNDLRLQRKLPIFRFVTLCSVLSCNEYPCWSNIYDHEAMSMGID
jgi:hypothetical protein